VRDVRWMVLRNGHWVGPFPPELRPSAGLLALVGKCFYHIVKETAPGNLPVQLYCVSAETLPWYPIELLPEEVYKTGPHNRQWEPSKGYDAFIPVDVDGEVRGYVLRCRAESDKRW
jgi:hypothetical protein